MPARLEDLPASLRIQVQALKPAYQARFLAWFRLLVVQLERRPKLLDQLVGLATSGQASSVEEWELALAFTAWAADRPADDLESTITKACETEATSRTEDEEGTPDGDDASAAELEKEYLDRLDRLEALFAQEVVPWQAIDLWFVVPDDANPLFDGELVTRRAALLHTILTRVPERFTVKDLEHWCTDPELIVEAIIALEQGRIISQESLTPTRTWRKVMTVDDLRRVVPAGR